MKKTSLSVVIPCYNIIKNDAFLNELLKNISVQKESLFYIEEIILINDSPQFDLEGYIKEENRTEKLKIITNSVNSGQAFSRNAGLQIAKGEYIHFIDQDDLIDDDFYSRISSIENIIITNCYLFNELKTCKHTKFSKDLFLVLFRKIKHLRFFLIFDNIVLSPGQVLFKREVVFKNGGFPILQSYGSDDYGLMFNLAHTELNYTFSKKSNFRHRLHEVQGKKFLNMSESKKEFIGKNERENNLFNYLNKANGFLFGFFKKVLYLLFYNRI